MTLRDHRVKTRMQIPAGLRRREGVHLVRTRQHEPRVCPTCYGKGHVFDVVNNGDAPVRCETCGGEGEV
jgi:DnaJ-class molecular chaperone